MVLFSFSILIINYFKLSTVVDNFWLSENSNQL